MADHEQELRTRLREDPGDPVFADLAQLLRQAKRYEEARQVCYRGLSVNPAAHRGRLILAWLYYDEEYFEFARREVVALRDALPESEAIVKLASSLGEGVPAAADALPSDPDAEPSPDTSTKLVSPLAAGRSPQKSAAAQSPVVAEAEIDLDDLL